MGQVFFLLPQVIQFVFIAVFQFLHFSVLLLLLVLCVMLALLFLLFLEATFKTGDILVFAFYLFAQVVPLFFEVGQLVFTLLGLKFALLQF